MLRLRDLAEHVFVVTGEFILQNFEDTLLDYEKFWRVVRLVLPVYNKYKSHTIQDNLTVGGNYTFTFQESLSAEGSLDDKIAIVAYSGSGGNITIQLVAGGSAGSESVSFANDVLSVEIEDGVSTQQQIADAITKTFLIETTVPLSPSDPWTLGAGIDSVELTGGETREGIPRWVSNVIPCTIDAGISPATLFAMKTFNMSAQTSDVKVARPFDWRYEAPKLYCSETGLMDVTRHHEHPFKVLMDGSGFYDVEFETLSLDDEYFVNLVVGKFLVAIGKSRRAFTLNDLPLSTDASELVSEGNEIYDNTLETLQNVGDWWKAIS